jgi:glutamate synthase (NADPH) small chain
MGKTTGFMEFPRQTAVYRPVEQRLTDYKEIPQSLPADELGRQGARCMDCGIPYCHAMGCPVFNLIPEWNDAVYRGDWREALARLEMTNSLAEITGRICPAPCETSCTLSINSSPVTIKQIELAIIENGFRQGWVLPHPPRKESGKKVAVVGSGPAGLAAAQVLRRQGHAVTVFEKAKRAGGILRYGIPDFKLEKWVLDRRIDHMRNEGVVFAMDVVIGDDLSARYLQKQFDVVLLTMGAGQPRDLQVPGRGLEGVCYAMDFLIGSNQAQAGEIAPDQAISAKDKRVLVIGGGDTGSDCVGTALRQGAQKVYQFEILAKPPVWKESWNPSWPVWPNILRTSTSHEEGGDRDWGILTKQFTGRDVRLAQGHFIRVAWEGERGERQRMVEQPGTEFSLDLDLVILAMGFLHVEHNMLLDDLGVLVDERGNIGTKGTYRTNVDGVFAAGDADIGASLVVRAIFHGREAAKAINDYLK